MSLRDAIDRLYAAEPDIAAVEKLTSETVRKRKEPFDLFDVFWPSSAVGLGKGLYGYNCNLCGAMVLSGSPSIGGAPSNTVAKHLDWHNSVESRLTKLTEETANDQA